MLPAVPLAIISTCFFPPVTDVDADGGERSGARPRDDVGLDIKELDEACTLSIPSVDCTFETRECTPTVSDGTAAGLRIQLAGILPFAAGIWCIRHGGLCRP